MSYLLGKDEGLYNPSKKFAFTNITEEDFTSYWNSQPIVVKPHQTVRLEHYLADKMTEELIDKIMIGEAKLDEIQNTNGNPHYRSPKGMMLGVPGARAVWAEQIVKEIIDEDQESSEAQIERIKFKEELLADINPEYKVAPVETALPKSLEEFADATKTTPTKPKKAIKPKVIK